MKPRELLLAIDYGTQSVRALVFDLQGRLVARSKVEREPYRSPHPGWAELDANEAWDALCEACRRLWTEEGADPGRLAGMALTTQRATVVPVDHQGAPLRPAISWLDQRRTENPPSPGPVWQALFKTLGMTETVERFLAEAECNWIAEHEPEVWRRTHKLLLLSGFLTYRLSGRFVDSVGSQVGYLPFDFKRHRWARSHDWRWKGLRLDRSQLPDLVPPGEPMGEVTAEAAIATGLPQGMPIVAGAADKACEVLGAGCITPDVACLSYGTTATVNTTHQRYVESIPLVPPYPAAIPGAYSLEVQIFRGYWMVSWFKREFGHREQRLAEERGVPTEALFDELLREVPPGSMGLMLQPFWSPGVKYPGPEAKGAIIGFGDVHRRAHVYRAIIEGIAYALREGLERCEQRANQPVRELRVAGGGSQSDAALQITADIFGLPTSRPHLYEASGLGAAIDAAVGLSFYPDFESAVASMTRVGETFEPDPAARKLYEQLYRRVYLELYDRLKPLYEEIRAITGYPP